MPRDQRFITLYPRTLNVGPPGRYRLLVDEYCLDSLNKKILREYDTHYLTLVRFFDPGNKLTKNDLKDIFRELERAVSHHGAVFLWGDNLDSWAGLPIEAVKRLLGMAGFERIKSGSGNSSSGQYNADEFYVGPKRQKLVIKAAHTKSPHKHDSLLTKRGFSLAGASFRHTAPLKPPVSFIITIHNEARSLPHYLSSLESIYDETGAEREFIFVLNACTDNSPEIISSYLQRTKLNVRLVECGELGILPAFQAGIRARKLDGYVGRCDADISLHPQCLDLMYMHLSLNAEVKVTYAEPLPIDPPSIFNRPWHEAETMSERLYYTGKTSLYREDPHLDTHIASRSSELIADDVFTSFYFVYYFGFGSISRAPHAVVYERVVSSFKDLVSQLSRVNSEIGRVFREYPHFRVLGDLMKQEIYPGPYLELTKDALRHGQIVANWTRLETTK